MPDPISRKLLNKTNRRTMEETTKISVASDTVKGPDIRLAMTSTASSWSINSEHIFSEGRLKGGRTWRAAGGCL